VAGFGKGSRHGLWPHREDLHHAIRHESLVGRVELREFQPQFRSSTAGMPFRRQKSNACFREPAASMPTSRLPSVPGRPTTRNAAALEDPVCRLCVVDGISAIPAERAEFKISKLLNRINLE